MAHKEQRRKKTLPLLLAALTLAGAGLWWGNYTLSVEEYAFSSSRLPPGWDGGRLVVLSDLHAVSSAGTTAAWRRRWRPPPGRHRSGGGFRGRVDGPGVPAPLLERLTALAPCYFVSGNHEWPPERCRKRRPCWRTAASPGSTTTS